jgi:arylsulfatase A-like enzyme
MPATLASLGYSTTSIGKDHFGWVDAAYGRTGTPPIEYQPKYTQAQAADGAQKYLFPPDHGHGVPHGYAQTSLYDGIVSEPDDYHQWFARAVPGKKCESGWPKLDMNSWRGEAFAYANESLHPTAWVGHQAVNFIKDRAPYIVNASLKDAPWFLKVSFHRPHSPYDPPQRFIDATPEASLRPVCVHKQTIYHGNNMC